MIGKLLSGKARRPTGQEAGTLVIRVLNICARTFFWAVCYHYFGSAAVLYVVAAWAFVLASKDLTFARVRLANMAKPDKRSSATIKSVALELALMAVRLALIAVTARVVLQFNGRVAEIASGLMLCAALWARETLINLAKVHGVIAFHKYVTLIAAVAGLAAIVLFAEHDVDAEQAAIGSILIREAIVFFGYALVALIGIGTQRFRKDSVAEDEEDDDEDGGAVAVIGADGKEIRSTFKIFIADNVVHSHWRAMQFGSRALAHGLLGPFGTIVTRLFFTYRRPGPYVHREGGLTARKVMAIIAFVAVLVAVAVVAKRYGLLPAAQIVAAGFVLRAAALLLNILFWRRMKKLVGERVPRFRRRA